MNENLKNIFDRIDQQLYFVESALTDLTNTGNDPKIRQRSLANIITFGRSVTFVIQNLRSAVKDFDIWYQPFQNEMMNDELLIFFKNARNNLEKQGRLDTTVSTHIKNLNYSLLNKYMSNPPENANGFFIGDSLGGSGWEILMPDGTKEKLYVDIENDNVEIKIMFLSTKLSHKGKNIIDTSIENCCFLYFQYLKNLVVEAKSQFLNN